MGKRRKWMSADDRHYLENYLTHIAQLATAYCCICHEPIVAISEKLSTVAREHYELCKELK